MVATFAAIVALQLRERPVLFAALVAGIVALLARGLAYKLGLMLAAIAGVTAGVLVEMWSEQVRKPADPRGTP
jgi:fructose-specific phosphotransferase system IIC component